MPCSLQVSISEASIAQFSAYNLKLLFGAGYTGLKKARYTNAYPAWDYMKPQMETSSGLSNDTCL